MFATLEDISFDNDDASLFAVDDPVLRADALRQSVVPRLDVVIYECIAMIRKVYGLEALDDSIVSRCPNFRTKRERQLAGFYNFASVGLGGKRAKDKWMGVRRADGKPVQIVPFRYNLTLSQDGLAIQLSTRWLKGLDADSYRKLFKFHLEHESLVTSLCHFSDMCPVFTHDEAVGPVVPLSDLLSFLLKARDYAYDHVTGWFPYPLTSDQVRGVATRYVCFYPVYDSYIRISLGEEPRFLDLMTRLNRWILDGGVWSGHVYVPGMTQEYDPGTSRPLSEEQLEAVKKQAEQKVVVQPALRWQVFARDGWRCVNCGRSGLDGVILEVDHKLARSRGGRDTLENLEVLCSICNRGKSNRPSRDLQKRARWEEIRASWSLLAESVAKAADILERDAEHSELCAALRGAIKRLGPNM